MTPLMGPLRCTHQPRHSGRSVAEQRGDPETRELDGTHRVGAFLYNAMTLNLFAGAAPAARM
jgi:hypothetical protein